MGTSGFADDTTMHSDGPDAVPAMQVMVRAVAPFLDWLGLLLSMLKSKISAINHATGLPVATDSITFLEGYAQGPRMNNWNWNNVLGS